MPGHRGYGSTEVDILSKEVIYDRLQALIPGEERQSNGHSKDHDATEDAGRGSEPDSPSSPGWGEVPRSPTLDLSSFQGVVEEGVLVNVAGSPGDVLEELGCLELNVGDDDDDDDEAQVDNITDGHTSVQAQDGSPRAEHQEEKSCNEEELMRHRENLSGEFCDFESCVDSNDHDILKDEHSLHCSSPEINNHSDQVQDDNEDPDQKSVSDAELANLLKTINSSDQE